MKSVPIISHTSLFMFIAYVAYISGDMLNVLCMCCVKVGQTFLWFQW